MCTCKIKTLRKSRLAEDFEDVEILMSLNHNFYVYVANTDQSQLCCQVCFFMKTFFLLQLLSKRIITKLKEKLFFCHVDVLAATYSRMKSTWWLESQSLTLIKKKMYLTPFPSPDFEVKQNWKHFVTFRKSWKLLFLVCSLYRLTTSTKNWGYLHRPWLTHYSYCGIRERRQFFKVAVNARCNRAKSKSQQIVACKAVEARLQIVFLRC